MPPPPNGNLDGLSEVVDFFTECVKTALPGGKVKKAVDAFGKAKTLADKLTKAKSVDPKVAEDCKTQTRSWWTMRHVTISPEEPAPDPFDFKMTWNPDNGTGETPPSWKPKPWSTGDSAGDTSDN